MCNGFLDLVLKLSFSENVILVSSHGCRNITQYDDSIHDPNFPTANFKTMGSWFQFFYLTLVITCTEHIHRLLSII